MKVTVIPIVIGTPGTIPKGLEKGVAEWDMWEWAETI